MPHDREAGYGRSAPRSRRTRPFSQRLSYSTPLIFLYLYVPVPRPCFPRPDTAPYKRRSKIGLNNTIKIRFICNGEDSVVIAIESNDATLRSPCEAAVALLCLILSENRFPLFGIRHFQPHVKPKSATQEANNTREVASAL